MSLINKVEKGGSRIVHVVNRETGEVLDLSVHDMRLARLRRRVRSWCTAALAFVSDGFVLHMVTLTYAPGVEWAANDRREFMLSMRRALGRYLIAYAIVAELQERGAVHYHVLLVVRVGVKVPYADESGIWPHGSTRTERARSPFYVLKYAQKGGESGHVFPRGLRLFDVWIRKGAIDELARWTFRLSTLPAWLRSRLVFLLDAWPVREVGGGWRVGPDVVKSPWLLRGFSYDTS